jgi:hypothetical protein
MKKIFTIAILPVAFFFFAHTAEAQNASTLFRHTVIIKFKPGATADSIQAVDYWAEK